MDVFGIEDVPQLLEDKELEQVQEAFQEQIEKIEQNPSRLENSEELKAGFEVEYTILDGNNSQASEEERDRIKNQGDEILDSELAASVIEARTDPISEPDSLKEFEQELQKKEDRTAELAENQGFDLLRYGTNPFPLLREFERSGGQESRYELFANFLDDVRNDEMVHHRFGINEAIDPRDIHYSGMISSTQTNLQAQGLDDAVDKANLAYMFAPYAEAIGANARIIEGKDTGISDMRMPLWEKSADIREDEDFGEKAPRAGKLESYFNDIGDYFERLDPIYVAPDADSAMDQAIANNWEDINIKFDREEGNALVEIRPLSIQPSVREDVALSAFMMGRIAYAQENQESLLDIGKVNRNRYTAMHNGLTEKLYDSSGKQREATSVIRDELDYARQGLDILDLDYQDFIGGEQDLFDVALGQRLESERTPGDRSAQNYRRNVDQYEMSLDDALADAMGEFKVNGEEHPYREQARKKIRARRESKFHDREFEPESFEDKTYDSFDDQFPDDGGFVGP
ncbi:MAG: gamma-glutamylcysteine synthetase [Candidatus Nanosalina sp. J07AB43]|nr:MAG: gamma-glutamylcysteine synthetase [Candidatus Nanosalina sp. J07AB43]